MVILLSYTFESQTAHIIQRAINTPQQDSLIEALHRGDQKVEIRDYLIDIVKQHPEVYGHGVGDEWAQGNFSTSIIEAAQDGTLMDKFSFCFEKMFEQLFTEVIARLPSDQKILLIYPVISYKPQGVDHFIGWAVNDQEYGIQHMKEHEHIEKEAAIEISNIHNNWMRDNKQLYDKFFDQTSREEIIEYIKGL